MNFSDFIKYFSNMTILRRPVLASNPLANPRGVHHFGVARGIPLTVDLLKATANAKKMIVDGTPQLIIAPGESGLYSISTNMDSGVGDAPSVAIFKPRSGGDSMRDGAAADMYPFLRLYLGTRPSADCELRAGVEYAIVPYWDSGAEAGTLTVSVVAAAPFTMSLLRAGRGSKLERVDGVEPIDSNVPSAGGGSAGGGGAGAVAVAVATHAPHKHPLQRLVNATEFHRCNVCDARADDKARFYCKACNYVECLLCFGDGTVSKEGPPLEKQNDTSAFHAHSHGLVELEYAFGHSCNHCGAGADGEKRFFCAACESVMPTRIVLPREPY